MKIKIISGSGLVDRHIGDSGLPTIFQTKDVLIKSDQVYDVVLEGEKLIGMVAGHVYGCRSSEDNIESTRVDKELLRNLFKNNSLDRIVNLLEGRYVAIKCGEHGKYEVACDHFGQNDLYYQKLDGGVLIGSDLSMMYLSSGKQEYDQAGLAHTLSVYGHRPPKKHTIYKKIKRLGVGEIALLDNCGVVLRGSKIELKKTANYDEVDLKRYSQHLLDSVGLRSSKKGNIVYLSSGWDSTALLACLVKIHGKENVRGVIGRMIYSDRRGVVNQFEIDRAKLIADYYGIALDSVDFDYTTRGPEYIDKYGSFMKANQLYNLVSVNCFVLAEYIAKTYNGESVFAGEISDGAHNLGFSQYATILHKVRAFREYSDKMASYLFGPSFMGLLEDGSYQDDCIYNMMKGRSSGVIYDEAASDLKEKRKQLLASFFLRRARVPMWSLKNEPMLTEKGCMVYSDEMESGYLDQAASAVTKDSLYSWLLHLYNSFHWQSSCVVGMWKTADQLGFNLSFPFLDSRIQEFLSEMPESWGRGLEMKPTKYPLKEMLANDIDYPMHLQTGPHSYLYDVDSSFSHIGELMHASSLAPFFKQRLSDRSFQDILSPEIFNYKYIDKLVEKYLVGDECQGAELSDLFGMSMLSAVGVY